MNKLTPEHQLLCDVAVMIAQMHHYSLKEQRALLARVKEHLDAVVKDQLATAHSSHERKATP